MDWNILNLYRRFVKSEMGGNDSKIPVVYRDDYNIKFLGLQKRHPFDSEKFGKIAKSLVKDGLVDGMDSFYKPSKVSDKTLREYHTKEYMDKISTADGLLAALEFNVRTHVENEMGDGWLKNIAKFVLDRESIFTYALDKIVGNPLKYQVGGTILAGELAMEHGWAINIGGGMHHASANDGGGWCVFADIQISIMNLLRKFDGKEGRKKVENIMIVDYDVHRGNGHAIDKRDKKYGRGNVFIVDIFDQGNYPVNKAGLDQIDVPKPLSKVGDEVYLQNVFESLLEAFEAFQFKPDVVFYNAGSDILATDPLGGFKVSEDGMMERDRLVFEFCLGRGIPVVMMTSGGYAKENAECVSNSLKGVLRYIKKVYDERKKEAIENNNDDGDDDNNNSVEKKEKKDDDDEEEIEGEDDNN